MMTRLENLRRQILAQDPTEEQKAAIFADELEFLLRAAPGSGKTWTSSRRFLWRGANWPYAAGGLALLSFTNAAIREFRDATVEVGWRELLSDPNYVGTFDAFVERFILSPFGHLIAGSSRRPRLFIAPRPGDWRNKSLLVWTKLATGRSLQVPAWEIIPYLEDNKNAFRASRSFGGGRLDFSEPNPVRELLALGYYTHSQRAYWACRLLLDRPHIAQRIARRFPEILVDEAQDTNEWLLVLLNFLHERGTKITLVGDPDQCIFEFSMADATSLPALERKWGIPERPLSRSFRCNNQIAGAVRNIGGNLAFCGCGDSSNDQHGPAIIREPQEGFTHAVKVFQLTLGRAGISEAASAIVCRGHEQLESIRGDAHYANLQGTTKELAQAAFFRDCHKDYKRAFQIVERAARSMAGESDLSDKLEGLAQSPEATAVRMAFWRFVKDPARLPPLSLTGNEWIARLRESLAQLFVELGVGTVANLNQKIKKTGLGDSQMRLPLFKAQVPFPPIRQATIHQVKGESIDAVLVLGSGKFWNSVVASIGRGENTEDRRLAYVAMTRARHLLAVGLPASHFDKHAEKWTRWGFRVL